MAARNTEAFRRSQAIRDEIRGIWLEHVQRAPFSRPLTAKAIGRQLTVLLSDRAVRWHMRKIQDAADGELNTLPPRQCID